MKMEETGIPEIDDIDFFPFSFELFSFLRADDVPVVDSDDLFSTMLVDSTNREMDDCKADTKDRIDSAFEMKKEYFPVDSSPKKEVLESTEPNDFLFQSVKDETRNVVAIIDPSKMFESKLLAARPKRKNAVKCYVEQYDCDEYADLSELEQKRARNRLHAKRSRTRKKVIIDSLEDQLMRLRLENLILRQLVLSCVPCASKVLHRCSSHSKSFETTSSIAGTECKLDRCVNSGFLSDAPNINAKNLRRMPNAVMLMDNHFHLTKSLRSSQRNFILIDSKNEGSPIIFATSGFLDLTGYKMSQVIGRNIEMLTGPATDRSSLELLSRNLILKKETSLCLLCYKADNTPFWNQVYVGVLRDRSGDVIYQIICMSKVNTLSIDEFRRRLHQVPLPNDWFEIETTHTADSEEKIIRSVSYQSTEGNKLAGSKVLNISPFIKKEPQLVLSNQVKTEVPDSSSSYYGNSSAQLQRNTDPLGRTRSATKTAKQNLIA